jgi:hypothetical protein
MTGDDVDVRAVTEHEAAPSSGVAHAETLVAFAEAIVGDDDAALARARAEVREKLGPEALVDAAAVASNFERMVRIADSTGIPLDGPLEMMSADLRGELGLGRFGSAANTPQPSTAKRALGRALRPVASAALKLFGSVSARARPERSRAD